MDTLRIGAGAGYAGDRIQPAVDLARHGKLDYLAFECLAERTIANAQLEKLEQPDRGYNPLLEERMERVLPVCWDNDVTIISNMGAANPSAAVERTQAIAADLGLDGLRVAAVTGSDVSDRFDRFDAETFDGTPVAQYADECISANVYMGVDGIVDALDQDADVIITGRVADPSLFLAPIVHTFGWSLDEATDSELVGQGIAAAHLLECAGQVTGGYFADPGQKDVDDLASLGFPYADISAEGDVQLSKLPDTGGEVSVRTCTEQILYEVHDPGAYVTPDGIADFSGVTFEQLADDVVRVSGADTGPLPRTLKVNIGYDAGVVGEGEISYAGPGAVERARLAGDVVQSRLEKQDVSYSDIQVDLVGTDSLHGERGRERSVSPYEVRLHVAAMCPTVADAERIGREVQTLYTNGPAGGGGASMRTSRTVGIVSTLIERNHVTSTVDVQEVVS